MQALNSIIIDFRFLSGWRSCDSTLALAILLIRIYSTEYRQPGFRIFKEITVFCVSKPHFSGGASRRRVKLIQSGGIWDDLQARLQFYCQILLKMSGNPVGPALAACTNCEVFCIKFHQIIAETHEFSWDGITFGTKQML